jgi:ABC-type branched-subunit amino acid transport system substrate-binding protein
MRRLNPVFSCFLLMAVLLLNGCVSSGSQRPAWTYTDREVQNAEQPPSNLSDKITSAQVAAVQKETLAADGTVIAAAPDAKAIAQASMRPVKVGILLPLSGEHSDLGQAMLQASQMALFDAGYDNFEILPQDTASDGGARAAAQRVVDGGAELVLGPVFADDVRAAKSVVQGAGINMIAYSTDWGLAGGNTFIMGFLPFDQVERVVQYAASQNLGRIAVFAPGSDYGRVVVSAYQAYAQKHGLQTAKIQTFSANGSNLKNDLLKFTEFESRQSIIQQNPGNAAAAEPPFDAVLMPVGGTLASSVGSLLTEYGLRPDSVKRLGTGLLDDMSLAAEPSLKGAWFAAPPPSSRASFERRFQKNYGYTPPRLTSLAYDSTALAAILAQRGLKSRGQPMFDKDSISNPNGFAGIDGIFRFRPDGTVERGLAIVEFRGGQISVIDEAPTTFQFSRF